MQLAYTADNMSGDQQRCTLELLRKHCMHGLYGKKLTAFLPSVKTMENSGGIQEVVSHTSTTMAEGMCSCTVLLNIIPATLFAVPSLLSDTHEPCLLEHTGIAYSCPLLKQKCSLKNQPQ